MDGTIDGTMGNTARFVNLEGLAALQRAIGYSFGNLDLLIRALTTREGRKRPGLNQCPLALMGDGLMKAHAFELLHDTYGALDRHPKVVEPQVSELVANRTLARIGIRLNVLRYAYCAQAQALTEKAPADIVEAILGAIHEDCGRTAGRGHEVVRRVLSRLLSVDLALVGIDDPVGALTSRAAARGLGVDFECYEVLPEPSLSGPTAHVAVAKFAGSGDLPQPATFGLGISHGKGRSLAKKSAAALALLELFPNEVSSPLELSLDSRVWSLADPQGLSFWKSA